MDQKAQMDKRVFVIFDQKKGISKLIYYSVQYKIIHITLTSLNF